MKEEIRSVGIYSVKLDIIVDKVMVNACLFASGEIGIYRRVNKAARSGYAKVKPSQFIEYRNHCENINHMAQLYKRIQHLNTYLDISEDSIAFIEYKLFTRERIVSTLHQIRKLYEEITRFTDRLIYSGLDDIIIPLPLDLLSSL